MSRIDGNTPILTEPEMRALGFTDRREGYWSLCKSLIPGATTFNVTINKANGNYSELVMDEYFGQPEYYGNMKPEWRDRVRSKIDGHLHDLQAARLTVTVDHKQYGCTA